MTSLGCALLCVALIWPVMAKGQTYLGISANFGNQMTYNPAAESFKTPLSVSGNFLLRGQQKLKNNWVAEYGIGLGVLAYNFKIVSPDTILTGETYVFLEYSNFYGNVHLLIGKEIPIRNRILMLGIGGGATYYVNPFPLTTYGVQVVLDDNSERELFYAEIHCPKDNIKGFGKITTQLTLNNSVTVALEYSYHFRPALNGFYEFYHTKTRSAGKISVYQRELSVVLLLKIGGRNE